MIALLLLVSWFHHKAPEPKFEVCAVDIFSSYGIWCSPVPYSLPEGTAVGNVMRLFLPDASVVMRPWAGDGKARTPDSKMPTSRSGPEMEELYPRDFNKEKET